MVWRCTSGEKLEQRKGNIIYFGICLFAVLFFLGVDCHLEMELDSYTSFVYNDTWKWMLSGVGRIIDAGVYYVFESLAVPYQVIYTISYWCAVLLLAASVYLYAEVIGKTITIKREFAFILSFLCVVNPHIVGYFRFVEKGLMNGAIFLGVCGCFFFERYARTKQRRELLYSLLCVIMLSFIYQIILGFFVIICIPVIVKYSNSLKSFVYNCVVSFGEYFISFGLSLVFTKILMDSERVGDLRYIFTEAIRRLFRVFTKYMDTMKAASNTMRPNLYPIFFILCVVLMLGTLFLLELDNRWYYVLYLVLDAIVLYVSITVSLAPWLADMAECRVPRTAYPCFAIAGMLIQYSLVLLQNNKHRDIPKMAIQMIQLMAGGFLVIYLFVQWSCTLKFFEDRYARNAIDCYEANYVQDRIEQYEQRNGTEVTKIVIYHDQNLSCNYFTMWSASSANPYTADFSDVETLVFFTGRQYDRGEWSSDASAYFSSKDWNSLNDEQFFFEGDTLHLCIF